MDICEFHPCQNLQVRRQQRNTFLCLGTSACMLFRQYLNGPQKVLYSAWRKVSIEVCRKQKELMLWCSDLCIFQGEKKQQRLLYGGKDLWRYLLQSAAQIRANFIVRQGCALSLGHSGFENVQGWGLPPSLASGIAGPCETCEMASTELFSRNTMTSEMREQKCSFKIWKAK